MRIASKAAISPIARHLREAPASLARSGATASGTSPIKLASVDSAPTEPAPASLATMARLQEIRAMLDKGEYPVDLDRLASQIVDDEIFWPARPALDHRDPSRRKITRLLRSSDEPDEPALSVTTS